MPLLHSLDSVLNAVGVVFFERTLVSFSRDTAGLSGDVYVGKSSVAVLRWPENKRHSSYTFILHTAHDTSIETTGKCQKAPRSFHFLTQGS